MKMTFKKHFPKERHYRGYKYFDQTEIKTNLKEKLSAGTINYESLEIEVIHKHAPLKKKFFAANHAPYMTKTLRKAIMCESQLATWGKIFQN